MVVSDMGIEIRPSAVMGQIGTKAGMLDALLGEVRSKRSAAQSFVNDSFLSGAGYDAAKQRVSSYDALFGAIEVSVARTKQVDARVSSALSGYFGGCGRVSEDEWREKQREAEQRYVSLEGTLNWLRRQPVRMWWSEWSYSSAMNSARESASYAGDMLSKIYSYCDETNGAYGGELAGLNACIARGCAAFSSSGYSVAGGWGKLDQSWQTDLRAKASKVAEEVYLQDSRDNPESVYLSGDGQYVYISGSKVSIEGADPDEFVQKLISSLVEGGVGVTIDLEALKTSLTGKTDALDILHAVGINKPGTYRFTPDGKIIFSDYAMVKGAKMTTRINVENISKYARPSAVFNAESIKSSANAKATGLKIGGGLLTGIFSVISAAGAYDKAYKSSEGKSEDRRRSDAEAAVVGSLAGSGTGVIVGAGVGAVAGTSIGGPVGAVVGIVGGTVAGGFATWGVESALETDFDGDGKSTQADIDEWWYSEGGHGALDWLLHDCAEAYWNQLTTAPTGMAR